ncbi:hypothetical protein CCR75_004522 [Bremia lactucae]|uniref:RxLR effector protein n=1 Tax=Bremia lactucae TaxID=4779 RepID=A0A976FFU0_BRELC|nr:hypothetical protein CCR75_007495 [Bremia lactucae]TDH66304.1 hypothetical protein CCR75_004522 [Bremia lactucae]
MMPVPSELVITQHRRILLLFLALLAGVTIVMAATTAPNAVAGVFCRRLREVPNALVDGQNDERNSSPSIAVRQIAEKSLASAKTKGILPKNFEEFAENFSKNNYSGNDDLDHRMYAFLNALTKNKREALEYVFSPNWLQKPHALRFYNFLVNRWSKQKLGQNLHLDGISREDLNALIGLKTRLEKTL